MTALFWKLVVTALCFLEVPGVSAVPGLRNKYGVWLSMAQPYVYELGQRCGADTGCLVSLYKEEGIGEDPLGEYQLEREHYNTSSGTTLILSARTYDNGIQIFKHEFPDGLKGNY
ncbi:hypothetical protein OTU49_002642, partial [Cherax quadricarinatus]